MYSLTHKYKFKGLSSKNILGILNPKDSGVDIHITNITATTTHAVDLSFLHGFRSQVEGGKDLTFEITPEQEEAPAKAQVVTDLVIHEGFQNFKSFFVPKGNPVNYLPNGRTLREEQMLVVRGVNPFVDINVDINIEFEEIPHAS
jgi:hypothetical protein